MINQELSILNDKIITIEKDEIVKLRSHDHPLYQIIDEDELCENAKIEACRGINNQVFLSQPVYFK